VLVAPARAVLFDFNGTLADDEPVLEQVFGEIFMAYLGWRMTPHDYSSRLAGRSDREIVEIAVAERGGGLAGNGPLVERLLALRRERYQCLVEESQPIRPSASALVEALAASGHRLGIVTGAEREDVDFVLARSDIGGHFSAVVAGGDVLRGKPDPEGFLTAAARLEVEPAHTVVFEDTVPGVRAAVAAGMRCVAVTGTQDAETLRAEGVQTVDTLSADLADLL
jgi:HAD superfamily hydrolase (TIGR01509 family)